MAATDLVVTAPIARLLRMLGIRQSQADRIRSTTYSVDTFGLRCPMSALNAAIGLAQLARFEEIEARRPQLWRTYRDALAGIDGVALVDVDVERSVRDRAAAVGVLRGKGGREGGPGGAGRVEVSRFGSAGGGLVGVVAGWVCYATVVWGWLALVKVRAPRSGAMSRRSRTAGAAMEGMRWFRRTETRCSMSVRLCSRCE